VKFLMGTDHLSILQKQAGLEYVNLSRSSQKSIRVDAQDHNRNVNICHATAL
jgi:hypothetical protein